MLVLFLSWYFYHWHIGAKLGTVKPTEEFIIERYSHVMHIVSNVVGELHENQDALSAFFAGMPAGTVSGAPKVRAMQIIDELETEKRGALRNDLDIQRVPRLSREFCSLKQVSSRLS